MSESKNSVVYLPTQAYKASNKESDMQTKEEVYTILAEKAKTDPIIDAVVTVMALRERNRHNLTLRGLYYKMKKEGFSYQQKDYIPFFQLLGELGLAKVHADASGKVDSVRDFKMPIQDIGAIAKGQRPTRVRVPNIQAAPIRPKKQEVVPQGLRTELSAVVTVSVNGKPIKITIPHEITKDELISILTRFDAISTSTG